LIKFCDYYYLLVIYLTFLLSRSQLVLRFLSALRYFLPSETNMACHKRSGYSDFTRVFLDKSDWKESQYTDLVSKMREKWWKICCSSSSNSYIALYFIIFVAH